MIEVSKVHKKDVAGVGRHLLSDGEEPYLTNNAFDVYSVNGRLSGKLGITVSPDVNIGSSSGSSRVVLSDVYVNFLAIVLPHSKALRTTGLNKYQENKLTLPGFSMRSMMRPISIRTGVC